MSMPWLDCSGQQLMPLCHALGMASEQECVCFGPGEHKNRPCCRINQTCKFARWNAQYGLERSQIASILGQRRERMRGTTAFVLVGGVSLALLAAFCWPVP